MSTNHGYQSVPVIPGPAEGLFTIAPKGHEDDFDESPAHNGSVFACCGGKKMSPKAAMTAMVYQGSGGGDYIKEETFIHVGKGAGRFTLQEPQDKESRSSALKGWLCCLCVVIAVLAAAGLAWLLLPEDMRPSTRQKSSVDTGDETITHLSGPPTAAKTTTRSDGYSEKFVSTLLKVKHVDYNALMADQDVRRNFITEVQQGVALTTKENIPPKNVTVSLSPGSVVVNATIRTYKSFDVDNLREELAKEAAQLEKDVETSLKMMSGLSKVQTGGEPEVTVVDVACIDSLPFDQYIWANTTQTTTSSMTRTRTATVTTTTKTTTTRTTTTSTTTTVSTTTTEMPRMTTSTTTVKVETTTTTTQMPRMTTSTTTGKGKCKSSSDCGSGERCLSTEDKRPCIVEPCVCVQE